MFRWSGVIAVGLLGLGLAGTRALADEEPADSALWAPEEAAPPSPPVCWSVRGGVLFLQRTGSKSVLLMSELHPSNSFVQLGPTISAGDLQFPMVAGPEISVFRQGPICQVEARYFGQDWETGTHRFPALFGGWVDFANPFGVAPQGPVIAPTIDSARYHSRLDSIELNVRRPLTWWLTPLVGFRYVGVDEQLDMTLDEFDPATFELANRNAIAVRSHNRLLGGQIGFDALLWRGYDLPFRLESTLKAGVYGNSSSNDARIRDSRGLDVASAASGGATSFVGEFGLTFVYQMTRQLNWRIGYEILGISGLATAPRQLSVSDPQAGQATVNSTGGAFYHGANLAAEYRW